MSASNGGVFLDTSALFAVVNAADARHLAAARAWEELLNSDAALHTSNYVLIELTALLQSRLGVPAVDALGTYVMPWVHISWIDNALHAQAMAGLLAAGRRDLTLVDCASFTLMRKLGLRRAFSLDRHFVEQGFGVLPEAG